MDPNACCRRILDAAEVEDFEEAYEALQDLQEWLAKGGFKPKADLLRMVNERMGEEL
jgi:hypothetical protein